MADAAFALYVLAMTVTLELAMPVILAVAVTGVAASLIQTAFGIQDQNIAFAPKIAVLAFLLVAFGAQALSMVLHMFSAVLLSLPRLAS